MKLPILLSLIFSAVCSQYAQAQKTLAAELEGDTTISGVIKVYQRAIPDKSVNHSDVSSQKKFFEDFTENNLELRLKSDNLNLSIRKRLAGVRNAQMKARNKLKDDFNLSLDSIFNKRPALALQEQERKVQDLRAGLVKSATGLRRVQNREYRYIYYRADTRYIRILPARNARFSQIYYGELKDSLYLSFLRHQFLTFNDDFGALSSEIVAGYLGPFRTSLSTAISRANEIRIDPAELEDKTDAEIETIVNENYQQNLSNNTLATVLAGGGLLALKAQYPLVYFNPTWSPHFKFDNQLVGTLAGQFPIAGSSTPENQMNLWGSYGIENYAYIPLREFTGDDEETTSFGFFFQYNIRHVSGSGEFENNLNINKGFWMGEFKTGIYYSGIQITYTYLNFSNKQLDGQFQNTFTLAYAPK